jgi:hypothetical protein
MIPTHTFEEVPRPSVLLAPGNRTSTFSAMSNEAIRTYVLSATETADVAGSTCTGALILAVAVSGAWLAWSALSYPSAAQEAVGAAAQPKVR